ncbi:magnesium transporter [Agromyces atrinae]|uniref:Magnesium transporter MgtE n=1 Tax=Agromyces atrinae TaxID=592376 RepID=A0A4Q2MAE6_9MICO|nr:magnesium transporter [Agromyces atrinae]MCI2957589.1 magnesium transporter [Agromyces atrinae]NYD67102.1 magnesium transporter [Agromyces atrinae]RXZ87051.1 magnesium transporter [Agromyces atrinae]
MAAETTAADLRDALDEGRLVQASTLLAPLDVDDTIEALYRLPRAAQAVAFRLLPKDRSLDVFERVDPALQRDLIETLADAEVAAVFAALDAEERVRVVEELPAKVAKRLIQSLAPADRAQTAVVLGYPAGSVGRRASPEYVRVFADETIGAALDRVRAQPNDDESLYTLPVVDRQRRLVGLIGLRELVTTPGDELVGAHMGEAIQVVSDADEEEAARECLDHRLLSLPVVDHEDRLVGLLRIDDAAHIIDEAHREDAARAGAAEPLTRPYLLTSVFTLTRSRIVWLLVLAVSAILTVNVLEIFEATLDQMVALALFIPLLTGIGGNTGSQAAVTVTRAIAMSEARGRDIGRVALKEATTGLLMGTLLGAIGFTVATLVYGIEIGWVIGLTVVAICTMAATVGGAMPLVAKSIRVDPAVFSTPFISTFCDATGLIIYFTIARAVLHL